MRGWTGSKRSNTIPLPRPMGVVLPLLALLSAAAGAWRHELVLTLAGAIPLAASAYCYLGVLSLSLFYRKYAQTLSVRMVPPALNPGQRGTAVCVRDSAAVSRPPRPRPPGILVRYSLDIRTADDRRVRCIFDPDYRPRTAEIAFPPPERGAYYGETDRLFILDLLGLFRAGFPLPQHRGERLLALPQTAEETAVLALHAGGEERRAEPHFHRTDDLIDHRPYMPGDDPRRINWKLYGHAGDLFIREGEPEPPPHSRLVILLDTGADPLVYGPGLVGLEKARRAVDVLCEQALALIREYAGRGMDILVGYTGGAVQGGGSGELAAALARPAAFPLIQGADLPEPPPDRNVLVLALPRLSGENSALDRFLHKRAGRETDLVFLYAEDGTGEAAQKAALFYNKRGGVHARSAATSLS